VKEETVPETKNIVWQTHRLREEGASRLLPFVVLGYGLALGLWWLVFPVPFALFLPIVALTSALSEFFFPVTYTITDEGVSVAYGPLHRLFLSWKEIKRATQGKEGVYLSSLAQPSRLDHFRGLRLRFAPAQSVEEREGIKETLRSRLVYSVSKGEDILCH
jgi:hypothetical protein